MVREFVQAAIEYLPAERTTHDSRYDNSGEVLITIPQWCQFRLRVFEGASKVAASQQACI